MTGTREGTLNGVSVSGSSDEAGAFVYARLDDIQKAIAIASTCALGAETGV
jgi:hypothetical protein